MSRRSNNSTTSGCTGRSPSWAVTREWDGEIVDQTLDQQIAWRAVGGTKNDGVVMFFTGPIHIARTRVFLRLEFEPEGVVEKVAMRCMSWSVGCRATSSSSGVH